jgi:hypothetical protein
MIEFKINSNEKIVVTEKSNCYGEQWWLVQYCSGSTLFTLDTETKRKRAIKSAKKYRDIFSKK